MSVEVLEMPEADAKLAPITKVKTEIARMRTAYSALTIKDVNDREGLLKVSTARKEVKAVRVQVEKERKALNEDALKWQRQVNDAAKEITTELIDIEAPLQKMEDDIIAEKQRIKDEAERLRKEKIQNRCQVIASFSDVKFDGVTYTLGNVSIGYDGIETLSDDAFQTKVEAFEAEYQTILTARQEAEKARQESEKAAKEEADRLEAQRKEQQDAADQLKREKEEFEAEKLRVRKQKREVELSSLGLVSSGAGTHKYKDRIVVSSSAFNNLSDEQWEAELCKVKQDIATIDSEIAEAEKQKAEAEEKRQAELKSAREEAAEKARQDTESKAKQDAEAKAESDRLAKEKEDRKLARRPDIVKFNDMTASVRILINKYSFNTPEGKKALEDFNTGIDLLIKSSILTKPE